MNTKHTPGPCEGTIKNGNCYIHPYKKTIVFCPLHAAATELLEAAKSVVKDLHRYSLASVQSLEKAIEKAERGTK